MLNITSSFKSYIVNILNSKSHQKAVACIFLKSSENAISAFPFRMKSALKFHQNVFLLTKSHFFSGNHFFTAVPVFLLPLQTKL